MAEHITYEQLTELQGLSLEHKILISKQRIQEWYEAWGGMVYVAFSGGKDSTVLLHLVRSVYPEVPAVFVDTGLEFPEIREFVKTVEGVEWLKPAMTFPKVIIQYGYPAISKEQSQYIHEARHTHSDKLRDIRLNGNKSGRGRVAEMWKYLIDGPFEVSEKCCNVMKKRPNKEYEKQTGRKAIIGVMADESSKRAQDYMEYGCNAFEVKRPISRPLGFWLESDIWDYLHTYNAPYCRIYDMGYTRTGCMFCAFGAHLEHGRNRFQRMSITHPKQFKYCMGGGEWGEDGKWRPSHEGLGMGFVLDTIGVEWRSPGMYQEDQGELDL